MSEYCRRQRVDRRTLCEGLGDVVESEAGECLVLVAGRLGFPSLQPRNTAAAVYFGKERIAHDLQSVRFVTLRSKAVML